MTYAKISPKMVNPRDIGGNTEDVDDSHCGYLLLPLSFIGVVMTVIVATLFITAIELYLMQ